MVLLGILDSHVSRLNSADQQWGRNWINFDATVIGASILLNTEYHMYQRDFKVGTNNACDEFYHPVAS